MTQVLKGDIVYQDGKPIFEFKGYEPLEIDEEFERKINSHMGAPNAECMDDKTKIKKKEVKPIDYGPIKDADGNIIETLPEQPPLPAPKSNFIHSIFH
jgi:hypothetical protein